MLKYEFSEFDPDCIGYDLLISYKLGHLWPKLYISLPMVPNTCDLI